MGSVDLNLEMRVDDCCYVVKTAGEGWERRLVVGTADWGQSMA